MEWRLKKFSELTVDELHDILRLRINVFVVEQDCAYYELDGKDKIAYHLFAFDEKNPSKILAYTRLFKSGDYYQFPSIGRVVVHPEYRDKGLGNELVLLSIEYIESICKTSKIKIGAQTYLKRFYEYHGFKKVDEEYIEDGIPHIHMIRN